MNEKTPTQEAKAKAERRASCLQRCEKSPEAQEHIKTIREADKHEAQLFAKRGYGGYIETEEIDYTRATREEAWQAIEKLCEKSGA